MPEPSPKLLAARLLQRVVRRLLLDDSADLRFDM